MFASVSRGGTGASWDLRRGAERSTGVATNLFEVDYARLVDIDGIKNLAGFIRCLKPKRSERLHELGPADHAVAILI